jgi:hypothetical protein
MPGRIFDLSIVLPMVEFFEEKWGNAYHDGNH